MKRNAPEDSRHPLLSINTNPLFIKLSTILLVHSFFSRLYFDHLNLEDEFGNVITFEQRINEILLILFVPLRFVF